MDFWQRSLYRARIAFLWGATAIAKIDTRFFISSLIDLKFGRRLEGDNTQNRTDFDFWISSPKKFGTPLNFAFALRPMGRKNSNRLYSSFRSCFGLIFSGLLGWRCKSLLWDFALWENFLNRFLSIFVCFSPSLIFPEPLKLARWNFNTPCKDDGAK